MRRLAQTTTRTASYVCPEYFVAAAALCLLVALSGCNGSTGPDGKTTDATTFTWPTTIGQRFHYEVEYIDFGEWRIDTLELELRDTILADLGDPDNGKRMYALVPVPSPAQDRLKWKPIIFHLPTKDSLVTKRDRLPSPFALVTPLTRERSWISAYADTTMNGTGPAVPSWEATILEHWSYRKIGNRTLPSVLEVRYQPLLDTTSGELWIRSFGEGIGVVETIKFFDLDPGDGRVVPQQVERSILIDTPSGH